MSKLSASSMMQHAHTKHIVMVCVTRQKTCARLIEQGQRLAALQALPLHVVHAVKTGENFLGNPYEGEALEYLFAAARNAGAMLSVLRADDVGSVICEYATAHAAHTIVLGESPGKGSAPFLRQLQLALPGVEIAVV